MARPKNELLLEPKKLLWSALAIVEDPDGAREGEAVARVEIQAFRSNRAKAKGVQTSPIGSMNLRCQETCADARS